MKLFRYVVVFGHTLIIVMFVVCALALVSLAGLELWEGRNPTADTEIAARLNAVLEGIGLLTIAVAALELAQTILEEEVQRQRR